MDASYDQMDQGYIDQGYTDQGYDDQGYDGGVQGQAGWGNARKMNRQQRNYWSEREQLFVIILTVRNETIGT